MNTFWVFIIGVVFGWLVSNIFIFPNDLLRLKLVDMTIGDVLFILSGVLFIIIGGTIGGFMGKLRSFSLFKRRDRRELRG
jgi:hypothetical protein